MSKIRRGGHSADGETLSAGRVEYLEAARARVRTRRIRRTVIIVAVLTILVLFATGAVGSSIARAKDLVDTAVIALAPAAGWPQQTGITDPDKICADLKLRSRQLRGIQRWRHPPEHHPERLCPPGHCCRQDPLCAVQPLRQ